MSYEEAEVLRERAEAFLENARRLFREGKYDLAAFSIEQYCQLILKYKLLVKVDTYPRTNSLTRLIRELARISKNVEELLRPENVLMITRIEDAYIGARYLPRRYLREEVEAMLEFVERVFKNVIDRA